MTYDEFDVSFAITTGGVVVGVVIQDSADGEIIMNLPVQNGGSEEDDRVVQIVKMASDLLTLCLDGTLEAKTKGESN